MIVLIQKQLVISHSNIAEIKNMILILKSYTACDLCVYVFSQSPFNSSNEMMPSE